MDPSIIIREQGLYLGAALIGAILLVFLLKGLNRRLHIFTKGTVSFILFVLIVFTTVDTISILNGVRNSQNSAKSAAGLETTTSFVLAWLNSGRQIATHQLSSEGDRAYLLEKLNEIEDNVTVSLERLNSRSEKMADLKLVALHVNPRSRFDGPRFDRKRYEYTALLDDGNSFHRLQGRVSIKESRNNKINIASITGNLSRNFPAAKRQVASIYEAAESFQSPDYQCDSTKRRLYRRPQQK